MSWTAGSYAGAGGTPILFSIVAVLIYILNNDKVRASLVAQPVKNLSAMWGIWAGLGRSPGEGKGYPLQYSGLEKSMNCIVHEVTKTDFHFHIQNYIFI